MLKKTTLGFKSTGVLNTLVLDYLSKHEALTPFYNFYPDEAGFKQLIQQDPYKDFNHSHLSVTLLQQSRLVENTSEHTLENIQRLAQKNTFTVTTGHQLCLFTGPLYFIYKIFSTINLAERLKRSFPAYDFVPVYWMASEDHDFEEVNHFHALGRTLRWNSGQGGAVGSFKTAELKSLYPALQELLGRSEHADYLLGLFERAYLKHQTLADATRFLVNELFGAYGLVTIDGDDKNFKLQFREMFRKDILEHSPFAQVNSSIKALENAGYSAQVNPRTVNCFYIEEGLRSRIEPAGEQFNLVGTKTTFTKKELEEIIEHTPEKISPNVVLRPAYQQVILPNLAYVGGPGELAYWLEFKAMFDASGIVFPLLMPRNFVTVIDKPTWQKAEKLKLSSADLYKPEQELIKELQLKKDSVFELASEAAQLSTLYAALHDKASAVDKTLQGSVSAELQRALNGLGRITRKTNRAIRRKYSTEISQIEGIKQRLFPEGIPQERYENFASLYLAYGPNFFNTLKAHADPLEPGQIILTEN